jgi:hypothetical protein
MLLVLILMLFLCGRGIPFEKRIGKYRITGQYLQGEKWSDTVTYIDIYTLDEIATITRSPMRTGIWNYTSDDSGLCAYTIYGPDTIIRTSLHYVPDTILDYFEPDSIYKIRY